MSGGGGRWEVAVFRCEELVMPTSRRPELSWAPPSEDHLSEMERHPVWRLVSLVALCVGTHSHDHQPSYLLLTPRSLRPGVPTSVSVTALTPSPIDVSARIAHGNKTLASNHTAVEGGTTGLLMLPPIHEATYRKPYFLEVQGHAGAVEVFSNRTELHFDSRCLSTFIQTDKLNYRPKQEVKIRVVSVHPDGKPYVGPVDIIIRDPRGNRLRQWLNVDAVLGVVSRRFQLSDNPPLGQWTVVAAVNDVSSSKSFKVASYVLPKFEVVIKAPKIVHQEDVLRGSVSAKYTYGKPVRGHMNITFLYYFHGIEDVLYEDRMIDGEADFMFDVPDYHLMYKRSVGMNDYDAYGPEEFVTVVVHVMEHLTGLTHHSAAKVSVTRFRYKLCFDGYSPILKPSLTFTARLKISRYNGDLLSPEDRGKTVHLSVMQRRSWQDEMSEMKPVPSVVPGFFTVTPPPLEEMMPEEMEVPISAEGEAHLFIPVLDKTETLTIDAYFGDSYNSLHLYRSYTSPSRSYLRIQTPVTPLEVGSPVQLHVESNFPVTELHYIVKSRGQLVSAGKSAAALTLVPECTWAPRACVIVYCVRPSGEIVSDVAQLHVVPTLKNWVSLSWSEGRIEPGDDVTLRVDVAERPSLVGVLVVDEAAKWAGSHNDITMETVMKELGQYGSSVADVYLFGMGDPYSVFQSCDLVALTDATLHMNEHRQKPVHEGAHHYGEDYGPNMEHGPEPREHFPETWIWMDIFTNDSVAAEIPLTAPENGTTWTATAFVLSENLGLGLVERPAELTVFRNFFLSLDLPAFIIRGEELLLEIILFNYLPTQLEVMVIVAQSDAFQFVFPDDQELSVPSIRRVLLGSQSGTSVLVPIRPLVLGNIPVSVKAQTHVGSQFVRKTVLVKAEGLEQTFSSSLLFEVSPPLRSPVSRQVSFSFPPDVVEGSQRVSVAAIGDILGPSISGLDSLIQMPHGCGEQNMINFAPNIYVLQYLTATGQDDQETTDKATGFMMAGYERELSFQRLDGSFSAFGERDSAGSTWLSAFVLRCFLQARPFISIDGGVLHAAASWLVGQQGVDGRFEEHGRVIHTELQGGLDGPVSLTAYVLIALLEDHSIRTQFDGQVSSALMFLETRLALGVSSNYSLSLLTYALALAGSSNANAALSELIGRAEMDDGVPMWSSPDNGLSSSWQPRSSDIEMAAYVLLSQHKLGLVAEGLSLMKWLGRQRNHRGGFGSTQDTVVALQALATFAALDPSHNFDVTIKVNTDVFTTVATFHIHQGNYLLHQSQQIEAEEELNLMVTAEGHGLALFQLNVFYNVRNDELMRRRRRREVGEHEAFHLHVQLMDLEMNSAHLFICSSLVQGLGLNATGMAVMEVGLLSGLSLAPDGLLTHEVVKKVETPPGKVVLYLDTVTTEEMCLGIPLVMEFRVARVQEACVSLYDYYEPRRRAVRTYYSEWRGDLTSSSFCGDESSLCKGSVHYTNSAAPLGHGVLLACLLPAQLLAHAFYCS